MTTFTIQDLTPAQQELLTKHEALHALNMNRINNVPTATKEEFMEYGMNNPISASAIEYATQHAPVPQPALCESTQTPDLATIINTICTQLQLLATVIKEQPNTTPPEGNPPSLQETIALTLQQADWLKDMVQEAVEESIDRGNFEDAVSSQVSSCVDNYFCHEFSLDDHCDVNEMVNDAVADKIEEVVAEKLSEASVSISF